MMAPTTIPLASPLRDLQGHEAEIQSALAAVVGSGQYILGPQVSAFETALASWLDVAGTCGVASGTDAIAIALRAVGVGPGSEVITVSHTAGPTVAAIKIVGAVPVLVDVEPRTLCLDPARLPEAITPATRAILPVHLYGHPADIRAIGAIAGPRQIAVVEDCAQAQGATIDGRHVGTFGAASCFSFYPTKNLGALGDGGAIATSDVACLERVRALRTYGWNTPQFADLPMGTVSRLHEMQAAVLNIKLRRLDRDIAARRRIAQVYSEAFAGLDLEIPVERAACRHAYHLYVVRTPKRDALEQHLKAQGVGTGRHYPFPVHRQPGLMQGTRIAGPLGTTDKAAGEILSLPMFVAMTEAEQTRVIESVRSFFR